MRKVSYIGNGAYCYANSISMLLASTGKNTPPSVIEVLSGVGLGVFLLKDTHLLFFGWEVPDNGIDNALKILGYKSNRKNTDKSMHAPVEELGKHLLESAAVVGPLDMGYLTYNPQHPSLSGSDHFVVVYKITKGEIHLHDPAGFPHVQLPMKEFKLAWKAKKVGYGKDNYSYWLTPRKLSDPTKKDIYQDAIKLFQSLYRNCDKRIKGENWITGKKAVLLIADRAQKGRLTQEEIGHLTHFSLQLGAIRALDYTSFLDDHDSDLASLKLQQAMLFGTAHTSLVANNLKLFVKTLHELAEVESAFRTQLLEK